jgi:hypothetical protein
MREWFWAVAVLAAGPALAVASGRVVGPDGAGISGAQVCEYVEGAPERCVGTDATGAYRIEQVQRPTLLVRAKGFIATRVDAAPLAKPVTLERAAILSVTVVDAQTRQPIPKGKVMLDSPSGRRIGDFVPFNRLGVTISTLEPGDLFVRAQAPGYDPGGPVPVTLASGTRSAVTISLTKTKPGSGH